MRKFLPLVGLAFVLGCGVNPGTKSEPVEITGKVTQGGRPVSDVTLNLQVTTVGSQAAIPLKGGEFKAQLVPGRYTWFISEGTRPAAFNAVPTQYRAGAMDRQIDVASGTALDLKLD